MSASLHIGEAFTPVWCDFTQMFYIYIIHSESHDKYYIGHSDDPWRRIVEHNTSPYTSYTSKRRPWELKAVFEVGNSRHQALRVEHFIKRQKSRSLLVRMIDGIELSGELAQLVRVPHVRD